jgi:hypothetical protein
MTIDQDIKARLQQVLEENSQSKKAHTIHASQIGDPCLRRGYYNLVYGDKAKPWDLQTSSWFMEGKEQEYMVTNWLQHQGWRIERGQMSVSDTEYRISGRIEGFLVDPVTKEKTGFEIKSLERFTYGKINSIKDMQNQKQYWFKNWLAQATTYMALTEQDKWLFILKNKNAFQLKMLWYDFDPHFWGNLLQFAVIINEAVEKKEEPAPNYGSYCEKCRYIHICQPVIATESDGIELIADDIELESKLARCLELKGHLEEYNELRDEIKAEYVGRNVYVGKDYMIENKLIEVNPDPNPKPKKPYKYWKMGIRRL